MHLEEEFIPVTVKTFRTHVECCNGLAKSSRTLLMLVVERKCLTGKCVYETAQLTISLHREVCGMTFQDSLTNAGGYSRCGTARQPCDPCFVSSRRLNLE